MANNSETQKLFTKVTGLTFDYTTITDENKLAWLIPDGAMLDGDQECDKVKDTKALLSALNINEKSKIDIYDDEEENDDNSSNDDSSSNDD